MGQGDQVRRHQATVRRISSQIFHNVPFGEWRQWPLLAPLRRPAMSGMAAEFRGKADIGSDCRPMAIYKLQHCYSLLSSLAEKLLCARLMQWRHRAEGPQERQRADSEAEAFLGFNSLFQKETAPALSWGRPFPSLGFCKYLKMAAMKAVVTLATPVDRAAERPRPRDGVPPFLPLHPFHKTLGSDWTDEALPKGEGAGKLGRAARARVTCCTILPLAANWKAAVLLRISST